MTTSVVITAEHNPPMYPSEQAALKATGNKLGSGNGPRWAVWLTKDSSLCELLHVGFRELHEAEAYARSVANEIAALSGKDSEGLARSKVVRVD